MTDLRAAAEMALAGLKQCIGLHIRNDEELAPIIEYLEAALAQQALADSIRPRGKSITKVWVDEINQALAQPEQCICHRCIEENDLREGAFPLSSTRMILCPECGNKRCPKASDHRLNCTGSNESGQGGSVYAAQPEQDHGFDRTASHMAGEYVDTAPPSKPWVSLTDEQIAEAFDHSMAIRPKESSNAETRRLFARAIEAASRSKNNG